MENHGLVPKQQLTEAEIAEIERLATICNNYEDLHMRLDFGMIRHRPGQERNDFLYYEQGIIAGCLSLDNYRTEVKEVVLMVHPDYRRRGIGHKLLDAARDACKQRGVKELSLVCEFSSQSGHAFVQALGAQLDHAEHEMVLGTFRERGVFDERLSLRQAGTGDVDVIVSILATDFGDEELARQYVEMLLPYPDQHFYVARFGEPSLGCREPVGVLRVDEMEDQIGIYSFVVLPDYRGRGYGRQMLEEVIRAIRSVSQKRIMLDVDTENTKAIGLYLSVGFDIKTTYEYYTINV
jgi:ribosomal protein S18 acetylase RimI-like enzyme